MQCHCIACHSIAWHVMSLHSMLFIAWQCHCIACHCIACYLLHGNVIAFHVIALHVIALHCMWLHCMSDSSHALHLAFTCNKPYLYCVCAIVGSFWNRWILSMSMINSPFSWLGVKWGFEWDELRISFLCIILEILCN